MIWFSRIQHELSWLSWLSWFNFLECCQCSNAQNRLPCDSTWLQFVRESSPAARESLGRQHATGHGPPWPACVSTTATSAESSSRRWSLFRCDSESHLNLQPIQCQYNANTMPMQCQWNLSNPKYVYCIEREREIQYINVYYIYSQNVSGCAKQRNSHPISRSLRVRFSRLTIHESKQTRCRKAGLMVLQVGKVCKSHDCRCHPENKSNKFWGPSAQW